MTMSADEPQSALHVPARSVPIPRHLSPEAQASLAMPANSGGYPALDDREGWRRHIAASDAMITGMFGGMLERFDASVRELREGAARAYEIVPDKVAAGDRRLYLDIHGGALIMGAGDVCRMMGASFAKKLERRVITVDYRMPPDHPYPAGLDDCLAFYRAALRDHRPEEIIVGGASAGGNLAAALLLRARDEGLPLPAAAVLLSPELDLTESGDSFHANKGLDTTLGDGLMQANLLYAGGHDLTDPYVSPLFGDFAKGFPPTFLTAGTRDLFLSNAVRMHRALRRLGIPAELHIMEAAPHGASVGWPEAAELDRDMVAFCEARWAAGQT